MPRENQNLIRKMVKIHPNQQEMLDVFTEKWGFISESEVIRSAIAFMYKKWEPEYLQPSSREKDRLNKQREQEKESELSHEQYALQVLHGVIKKDKDGKFWVLSFGLGNTLYCTPLEKVRTFATQEDGWYLKNNLGELAKGRKIEDTWQSVKAVLIGRHGLVDESVDGTNDGQEEKSN